MVRLIGELQSKQLSAQPVTETTNALTIKNEGGTETFGITGLGKATKNLDMNSNAILNATIGNTNSIDGGALPSGLVYETTSATLTNKTIDGDSNTITSSSGAGAPSASAALGEFYYDTTNDDLYVNSDGATAWQLIGGGTAGDITGVTAGTGLSGGGTSGTVTLSIDSTVVTLTGSQTLTNKTLTTPTIGDFTNAGHNHSNTANGGTIAIADTTGTLAATKGGTGLTAYATGAVLYASATNTLSTLAIGTTGQILAVSSGGVVEWIAAPTGDITGVTAGAGLTGGGTSGSVTLDVGAGNGISVAADSIAINLTDTNIFETSLTSSSSKVPLSSAVKTYVDSAVQGLDWQDSVIDRFDPTSALPVGPSTGDRYISTATANGWTVNNIYEYNGASWDETTVSEGMSVWVEDEDVQYVFNGTAWVKFGSTVTHNNTAGLQGGTTDEYYHLTATQRTGLVTSTSADSLHTHPALAKQYTDGGFTSQTSVSVTHNLGRYPVVQAIDTGGFWIIPANVQHTSVNAFTVTFAESTSGTIVYIG